MKVQYGHSGNITSRSTDEGENDDADNGQDSVSDDDSDDDSDRKGTFRNNIYKYYLCIYAICYMDIIFNTL